VSSGFLALLRLQKHLQAQRTSEPSPDGAVGYFTAKFKELLSTKFWEDPGFPQCEACRVPICSCRRGCGSSGMAHPSALNPCTLVPYFWQVLQDPRDLKVSYQITPTCHLPPWTSTWSVLFLQSPESVLSSPTSQQTLGSGPVTVSPQAP
jgi:hypothetical protein